MRECCESNRVNISTFSIVARDPKTGELGIAVQSKFLAVGAVVPWAKAGVGAIATQAAANLDYGELGLKLLKKGYSPQAVLDALLALDDGREDRQVGIVDAMVILLLTQVRIASLGQGA